MFNLMSEEYLTPADNVPGCALGGGGSVNEGADQHEISPHLET